MKECWTGVRREDRPEFCPWPSRGKLRKFRRIIPSCLPSSVCREDQTNERGLEEGLGKDQQQFFPNGIKLVAGEPTLGLGLLSQGLNNVCYTALLSRNDINPWTCCAVWTKPKYG